jgi:phage terminase Nu1 subunit (DNA packaging protein)
MEVMEMVTKKKQENKQFDLKGIESICKHTGVQPDTIMDWRSLGLPIHKVNGKGTFFWAADRKQLDNWLRERGITDPRKTTRHDLEEYELSKMEEAGKLPEIRRTLKGINQIVDFCSFSMTTICDWVKYRDGIPIKKENGELTADCDELLSWMSKNGFLSAHAAYSKRQTWRTKDNYI